MASKPLFCRDCGKDGFVWDRDGDVTCTSCGLVHIERYIDDTYYGSYFQDACEEHKDVEEQTIVPKDILHIIEHRFDEQMQNVAGELYAKCFKTKIKTKSSAIYANCLYYANLTLIRGYTIEDVIKVMSPLSPKDFYENFNDIGKIYNEEFKKGKAVPNKSKSNAMISRYVHMCEDISHIQWDVIKLAIKLYDSISTSFTLKMKDSKLLATIVYVSIKILKLPIDIKEYCRDLQISLNTLKKHEKELHNIIDIIIQN